MLMGAKIRTLEHRDVALVALEPDRPAQGFHKTGTVVRLQDKDCRCFTNSYYAKFGKLNPANLSVALYT